MKAKPYSIILVLSVLSGILWNTCWNAGIPLIHENPVLANENILTVKKAKSLFESHSAVFVDARSETEFAEEHISGAINIPHDANRNRRIALMEQISKKENVIVYCLDPTCNAAERIAGEMRFVGFEHVAVMQGGLQAWSDAGYPVEVFWK